MGAQCRRVCGPCKVMKNNGGASFSLQRRLQPAIFARAEFWATYVQGILAYPLTRFHGVLRSLGDTRQVWSRTGGLLQPDR